MVNQPGYRWHRLHHRVHDDAAFGLVNIVEWESVTAWQAAHDAGFRARAVRDHMPFDAHPTLCRPTVRVNAALYPPLSSPRDGAPPGKRVPNACQHQDANHGQPSPTRSAHPHRDTGPGKDPRVPNVQALGPD